ncbi:MAG TPA: RHS repeat-associated core domain-containing protein [Candidatus Saccharimonadales bacterium]
MARTIVKHPYRAIGSLMTLGLTVVAAVVLTTSQTGVQAIGPLVLGDLPYQTLQSRPLTDRVGIDVNVANGNLILKSEELKVASVGPDLNITRYYNNLGSGSGQVGMNGTLSIGGDITITANANGSATYQGPSGFRVTFLSNGAGGYTTPAAYTEAKLSVVTGGGWKLTFNKTGEFYIFNAAGKQIKHTDAAGLELTYAYNTNGTLASATDAQGKITTFTNYSGTNIGTITDPAGRTVNYTYTSGKLTGLTDTMGGVWKLFYFPNDYGLNQIDTPSGKTTTIVYNAASRVTKIKYADYTTAVAEYNYTYNTNNTVVSDPLSHNTTYSYDAGGRVIDIIDAVGESRGATWDANNNQTAIKDPSAQIKTATFDTLNNLTARQNPTTTGGVAGSKSTYEYNNTTHPHLPSKAIDSAGNTTTYTYNTNKSVTSEVKASASGAHMATTTYKYQGDSNGSGGIITCNGKNGQLCIMTDPRGNLTTYSYDTNGNLIQVVPPGPMGRTDYTYDNLARVKTVTDGVGSKVTIDYDNADRPTVATYAKDGSVVDYDYNADGTLIQRIDASGTTTYTHDVFNRVVYLGQPNRPGLNYTYDAAGNLLTEVGPAGTTTYTYDNANQLASINQSSNGATQTATFTDGRMTAMTLPGGITQTMTYDNAGRKTSIKAMKGATVLTHFTGSYTTTANKDSDLLQSETNNLLGRTSNYVYDGLNRLTAVNGVGAGANSYTYAYDANGNRTQHSKNGNYSSLYGFNVSNHIVTATGNPWGTFDTAGNQTWLGRGVNMGYNAKNQTTAFTPAGNPTITASYADVGQTDRTQIGADAQHNGILGLYSDVAGTNTRYYTHSTHGDGPVVGEVVNGAAYYFLTDLRGSIVKVTDINGTVQNTYDYDPYGTLLSSTGSVQNPWRYAGAYYDYQTQLYKMGARYYNSTDARWTQLDPSGVEYGYVYAGANPVNLIDPSGYAPCTYTARSDCLGTSELSSGFSFKSGGACSNADKLAADLSVAFITYASPISSLASLFVGGGYSAFSIYGGGFCK